MGILLAPAGAEFIELALQVGHEYALAPGKERWNNETDLLPASGWSITEDVFRTWVPEIVPQAPAGKAGNWLATVPGKGYFVISGFLRPDQSLLRQELEARKQTACSEHLRNTSISDAQGSVVLPCRSVRIVVSFWAHTHDHTLNLRSYTKETGDPEYALH
jgi:hypothetical protein